MIEWMAVYKDGTTEIIWAEDLVSASYRVVGDVIAIIYLKDIGDTQ